MTAKYFDRVSETSNSSGTGDITFGGAVPGYQRFASVFGIADTFYYCIQEQHGTAWEVGLGTYSAVNKMQRTTVLSSSNGGNKVTFSSGGLYIFNDVPASIIGSDILAGDLAGNTLTDTVNNFVNLGKPIQMNGNNIYMKTSASQASGGDIYMAQGDIRMPQNSFITDGSNNAIHPYLNQLLRGGIKSYDWAFGKMYDVFGTIVVADFHNYTLSSDSTHGGMDWKNGSMYFNGWTRLDFANSVGKYVSGSSDGIYDTIDWQNSLLNTYDGVNQRAIYDWFHQWMYAANGSTLLIDHSGVINFSAAVSFSSDHMVLADAILDTSAQSSLDTNYRKLFSLDGTTCLINFQNDGYDNFAGISFSSQSALFNQYIKSNDGGASIDTNARHLLDSGSNYTLDYENQILQFQNTASWDWKNRLGFAPDGSTILFDYSGTNNASASISYNNNHPVFGQVIDDTMTGTQSMNTNDRYQFDSGGIKSYSWQDRINYAYDGTTGLINHSGYGADASYPISFDGAQHVFFTHGIWAAGPYLSIDVENFALMDYAGQNSVRFANHSIHYNDGSESINYGAGQIFGNVAGGGAWLMDYTNGGANALAFLSFYGGNALVFNSGGIYDPSLAASIFPAARTLNNNSGTSLLGWGGTSLNAPYLTASCAVVTDGSKNIISSATTLTELGYVSGVTSAIQTQLNAKANLYSGSFSGSGTATTSFVVTIGTTQANANYKVAIEPTNVLSSALQYISAKTTTTFTVTYLTGLTGTVAFDWILTP